MQTTTPSDHRGVALLVGLVLLLAACGGGDEGLDSMGVDHVLAFNGESCTYEGPTELTPGPTELIFLNESERSASMNLVLHLNNETIQEVIEYIGPEPSQAHHPRWSTEIPGAWNPILAGTTHLWEGNAKAGTYSMVCVRMSPYGVWFGTGWTVGSGIREPE